MLTVKKTGYDVLVDLVRQYREKVGRMGLSWLLGQFSHMDRRDWHYVILAERLKRWKWRQAESGKVFLDFSERQRVCVARALAELYVMDPPEAEVSLRGQTIVETLELLLSVHYFRNIRIFCRACNAVLAAGGPAATVKEALSCYFANYGAKHLPMLTRLLKQKCHSAVMVACLVEHIAGLRETEGQKLFFKQLPDRLPASVLAEIALKFANLD